MNTFVDSLHVKYGKYLAGTDVSVTLKMNTYVDSLLVK
jgi:hypothetical protein